MHTSASLAPLALLAAVLFPAACGSGVGLKDFTYYSLSSSLTGGWGPQKTLSTYPEMQPANPNYTPNVFCYAAKEHVEFETAGQLFFTYACNSTLESDITNNMNLYHPGSSRRRCRTSRRCGIDAGWT